MKRTLLLLSLGAFLILPVVAQSTGAASTPSKPPHDSNGGPPHGGPMGGLNQDERQEVMAARKAALEANPGLEDQMKALQDKLNAAMIKADPKVAPLITKMEAAHQHHDGSGGPNGSGSSGSVSSSGKPPPPPPGN